MTYDQEGDERPANKWLSRLGISGRDEAHDTHVEPESQEDETIPVSSAYDPAARLAPSLGPYHDEQEQPSLHSLADSSSGLEEREYGHVISDSKDSVYQNIPTDDHTDLRREQETPATERPLSKSIRERLADIRQEALLNFGEMNALKQVFEHTIDHSEIEPEYLDAVRLVFTPSDNFEMLYDHLRDPGSVLVLNSLSNSGRTTTAHALLAQLYFNGDIDGAREISFGGSKEFPVKRLPHENRQGFLLELPPDEEESAFQVSDRFGSRIGALSHELSKRDNRLIVLTEPEQWRRICISAPNGIAPMYKRPRAEAIASKWVIAEEPGFPIARWMADPDIAELFEGAKPLDALQIVDLMLKAYRADVDTLPTLQSLTRKQANGSGEGEVFRRQVLSVVAARRNWREQLLDWHKQAGRSSFERNFLLAASVLRGAPVAHIYAKVAVLCDTLGEGEIKIMGQMAPGVVELVDAVDAELGDNGIISFSRPGWDDAVLEYFWIDRPLARLQFLEWLAEAPRRDPQGVMETITQDEREALAERIGAFALRWAVRHRRPDPLRMLAEKWYAAGSTDNRMKRLWSVLINILASAAIRDASAPYIHTMLLTWSKNKNPALQKAVVAVCSDEFGRVHTGKALRRLKYAGESEDPDVVAALRTAVRNLWEDPSVRQTLFGYIITWCRSQDGNALAGRRAFGILAGATSLRDSDLPALLEKSDEGDFIPTADMLSTGWRALLDHEPTMEESGEAERAVALWMTAALEREDVCDRIIHALSKSVDGKDSQRRRDLLRTYVYKWYEEGDIEKRKAREVLYSRLSQLIDNDLRTEMARQLNMVDSAFGKAL
ncbi:hypothetical protein ACOZ38_03395 [Sphaerisporangium viridialbum]|uniref:hypothetical protein n=1 Tax=Sphaerisporangium viridialbum TaxID=46189 RepID=UPI003C72E61C